MWLYTYYGQNTGLFPASTVREPYKKREIRCTVDIKHACDEEPPWPDCVSEFYS